MFIRWGRGQGTTGSPAYTTHKDVISADGQVLRTAPSLKDDSLVHKGIDCKNIDDCGDTKNGVSDPFCPKPSDA